MDKGLSTHQAYAGNQEHANPAVGWVLDTPLLLTDYAELARLCREWARQPRPIAIQFANTQVVTMRRHEPWYRALTGSFDYFAPDGMPLVWCLNRQGAQLRDRVYGPTFFRHLVEQTPAPFSHYFLGGSPEAGARLRDQLQRINPAITISGTYHGRCGADGAPEDPRVLDQINQLSPDFIWVGLGTPKQDLFIRKHKMLLKRGVLLSVGFAFDVNAGTKKDAPLWMQRWALTWVYRLGSEPRRLGPRYLKYNALFLFYLIRDGKKPPR
jgi:N-acetylglucosaminyldiphosphoundecaprenol N-acetyl-beta-D-mannosaminyltransferase